MFDHHLSKIRFKVVPGITEGKVNRVTLHSLKVDSKYKGTFRVASKTRQQGIKFDSEAGVKTFEMREEDDSPLQEHVILTLSGGEEPSEGEYVGGYLLVAPSNQGYYIRMDMSEIRDFGGPNEESLNMMTYDTFIYRGLREAPDPFEPGDEYTVTLRVFGRADVRVEVEMQPWENGGYVIPETEDIPE